MFGRKMAVGWLAVAALAAGCGSDSESGGGSTGESGSAAVTSTVDASQLGLVRDGELTACVDPTYPPLEYYGANKEFTGYDVAMAKEVAKALGVKPVFKAMAFSGILPALDSGRCDWTLAGTFVNPERTAEFIAVPYHDTTSVIMVEDGNPEGIRGPDDLSGKTVVTQNGTDLLKLAKKISSDLEGKGQEPARVQGYDKFEEAVQQLVVGRADAVITQDIDASYRDLRQPGTFEAVYSFPDKQVFGTYFKKDNAELAKAVHGVLEELEQSGRLAELAKQEGMPADGIAVEAPVGG
jgi:polar amino acid transport system substrate-binding protein